MPFCNDAFMKRMVIRDCRRRNELPMTRTCSFHAFPLELQMGERLMSPRRWLVLIIRFSRWFIHRSRAQPFQTLEQTFQVNLRTSLISLLNQVP
jgi:hypothetical protein